MFSHSGFYGTVSIFFLQLTDNIEDLISQRLQLEKKVVEVEEQVSLKSKSIEELKSDLHMKV